MAAPSAQSGSAGVRAVGWPSSDSACCLENSTKWPGVPITHTPPARCQVVAGPVSEPRCERPPAPTEHEGVSTVSAGPARSRV